MNLNQGPKHDSISTIIQVFMKIGHREAVAYCESMSGFFTYLICSPTDRVGILRSVRSYLRSVQTLAGIGFVRGSGQMCALNESGELGSVLYDCAAHSDAISIFFYSKRHTITSLIDCSNKMLHRHHVFGCHLERLMLSGFSKEQSLA